MLGGRYGKPGRQRQLYVCHMPKPGSSAQLHRFAAPLPRPHADTFSAASEPELDAEELRAARKYQFSAHDIATGLVAVSRGASYAKAGQDVRAHAARRRGEPAGATPVRHGTLVSDWVEVYAEALWQAQAPLPDRWPDTVLLGVLPVTVGRTGGASSAAPRLVFSVFVAMAPPVDGRSVVLGIRTGGGTGTAHWTAFLRELAAARPGGPSRIVGDASPSLARAVAEVWPGGQPPTVWLDEHELRAQARRLCRARGLDRRDVRLWELLQRAWREPKDWAGFVAEAHRYRLPELDRWLRFAEPVMARQLAARAPGVHRSRAEVRTMLDGLDRRLGARRAAFGNQARTDRLLSLMALDLSGHARVHGWARLICVWLEQGNGRPATAQRRITDRNGSQSLRGTARTR